MHSDELVNCRRSIRIFSEKAIPIEDIWNLIKSATVAPSAGNGQPWRFIIANNKAMLGRISLI